MGKLLGHLAAAAAFAALLPGPLSAATPAAGTVSSGSAGACADVGDGCFVLLSLRIDEVSAYPLRDLAPLYADYLARPISQADLVSIAQAITDKYRADGYFLSRAVVPPQGATAGHAHLRVYEGHLGELEVTGKAAPGVRALLAPLTNQRPLKLQDLERRLTLASELPGVRARTSIEPVLDDPADHRLVVAATLQPWTGSVSLDNRGTRSSGPDQVFARLGANSVLMPGDQIGVAALTSPSDPGEVAYGELSYSAPLRGGSRIRGGISGSRSRMGLMVRNNPVGSESRALNLRVSHPLSRGRKHAVWAAVIFDARHVEQMYVNGGAYQDELRVVRASLQASRNGPGWAASGFVQGSQGLEALGGTRLAGIRRSRFDADGQFTKLNAGASYYRDLGRRVGVYLAADGQWSPGPLLLSEEFAPGGLPYGRAYNYGEISGDSGVAGLAELRLGWDPKVAPLTFFQTYAFVDAAKVWNGRASFGRGTTDIASTGVGLRLTFRKGVTLRTELAKPIGPAPWETRTKNWRGFVSLWAGF